MRVQRADGAQQLILGLTQVTAQVGDAPLDEILDDLIVQVGAGRARHGLHLIVAAGLGRGQVLDLPPIQRLVALVGADEHAAVGQGVELGAARHVDRHRPARTILKRLPIRADQRAALHLRGAQEAFGVLDLQIAGHLTIGQRAEQHRAAVAIGERD